MNASSLRAHRAPLFLSAALLAALSACAGTPPPAPAQSAAAPVSQSDSTAFTRPPAPGTVLDSVAAIVNDDVILKSELDARVTDAEHQLEARHTPLPDPAVLQKQVLDEMVVTRIELQQAKSRGVSVSDDDVNQALSRIAQRNKEIGRASCRERG